MPKDGDFDDIDENHGFCATVVTYYAVLYPRLRQTAYELGYALALHGSLTRDLDVVAVPWTETAVDRDTLLRRLTETANGFTTDSWTERPHGRSARIIWLGSSGGCIDLSVMARDQDRAVEVTGAG